PYRAPRWSTPRPAEDGVGSLSHNTGDWNVFYLYLHNMDFQENRAACPNTCRLIQSLPRHYSHAFFSALAPGTHVVKHHGPTNKKLRVHLPLLVPQGEDGSRSEDGGGPCPLRVGNETVFVKEGRVVAFDDSFEHEAWNND
ncbi:unnamed protein product, partial [Discosporangium mesarthrocarpum]